jgi:hypothetical protein
MGAFCVLHGDERDWWNPSTVVWNNFQEGLSFRTFVFRDPFFFSPMLWIASENLALGALPAHRSWVKREALRAEHDQTSCRHQWPRMTQVDLTHPEMTALPSWPWQRKDQAPLPRTVKATNLEDAWDGLQYRWWSGGCTSDRIVESYWIALTAHAYTMSW